MLSVMIDPNMDSIPSAMAEASGCAEHDGGARMDAADSVVGHPRIGPCAYCRVDHITTGIENLPQRDGWTAVSCGGFDGLA